MVGTLILSGCMRDNDNLKMIEAKGLLGRDESFDDVIFVSKSEGYIFGSRSGEASWHEDGSVTRIDTAIIYNTEDGGKNWKSVFLGQGRTLFRTSVIGGEIYAQKASLYDPPNPEVTVIFIH